MITRIKARLNRDIHFKEILTGSAVTFVLKMSGMLLGYIVTLIIARKYGAEGVGVYSISISIITFFSLLSMMGMNVSILRYAGQFNNEESLHKLKSLFHHAMSTVVPLSILFGILLFFSAEWIATTVFHNQQYAQAIQLIAVLLPLMASQDISIEFIRGLKKLKISEYFRSVNRPLFNVALLLIFGTFVANSLLPLYTYGIGVLVGCLLSVLYVFRFLSTISVEKSAHFSKKELLSTSFPMLITVLASFMMGNISLFLLEIYCTSEEVGVFSVAFKIATLISIVLTVVNTISAPKFAELFWANRHDELQKTIIGSTNIIFITSLIATISIFFFSYPLLSFFGKEFTVGQQALTYLVIAQLINSFTGSVGFFMNMTGKQNTYRNITLFALVLNVVCNFIFIPRMGIDGAALSILVSTTILNVIASVYVRYKFHIKTYFHFDRQGHRLQ